MSRIEGEIWKDLWSKKSGIWRTYTRLFGVTAHKTKKLAVAWARKAKQISGKITTNPDMT